MNVVSISNI